MHTFCRKHRPSILAALLVCCLGGFQLAWAQATTKPSIAADTSAIKPDWDVEALAKGYCPAGLERFLPGSYYYCVGVRDLARGDTARSRSMLKIAAAWGSKSAEFLLGIGYYKGDSWPLNRPLGLAWMGLAAERKDPAYTSIFTSAWKQATPQEQAAAQILWEEMLPKYGDARAAHRAALRYSHERDAMTRNAVYGAKVCIEGINAGKLTSAPVGTAGNAFEQLSNDSPCPSALPPSMVADRLDRFAEQLFEGWTGHVIVGTLQQVPAPSK